MKYRKECKILKLRKDQVGIDGESDTEKIALKVFYGEFVFGDLWFSHKDIGTGTNIELADLIINIGNDLLAFQVKTRNEVSLSLETGDKKWVAKQIKKAKDQLVDTFHNIQVEGLPGFVNQRGDSIFLEKGGIFSGIIILKNERVLEYPKIISCNRLQGILHCFTEKDFNICCERLVIPKDILSYLYFRERYYKVDQEVEEKEEICLSKFLISKYGTEFFDNSFIESFKWIINHYKERLIEENKGSIEYREIIQVLAMLDRMEIDTFTNIFLKLLNGAQEGIYTDHMFMKSANEHKHSILFISQKILDRKHANRVTQLFMYKSKVEKCLTVILCLEDEMNFEVDWLLLEYPWEKDAGMERMIEELGIQNKWIPKKILTGKYVDRKESL